MTDKFASDDFTPTERKLLILMSEDKSILDIANEMNISLDVFNSVIEMMMLKTKTTIWSDLCIIGARLAKEDVKQYDDPDALLKEHIEVFCDYYENLTKEHLKTCDACGKVSPYFTIGCSEYQWLQDKKTGLDG